jgi:capsular exopolysaccharide synthesis family protein
VIVQSHQPVAMRPPVGPRVSDSTRGLYRLHWYISPLRRWAPLILLLVLAAGVGAYAFEAKLVKPTYQAIALAEVDAPQTSTGGGESVLDSQQYAPTAVRTIRSLQVATLALGLLQTYFHTGSTGTNVKDTSITSATVNGQVSALITTNIGPAMGPFQISKTLKRQIRSMPPQKLLGSITVTQVPGTQDLSIASASHSKLLAALMANFTDIAGFAYQSQLQLTTLKGNATSLLKQISNDQKSMGTQRNRHHFRIARTYRSSIISLQTEYADAQASVVLGATKLLPSVLASIPASPIAPHPLRSGAIAAMIVLLLLVGGIVLREYLSTTLRTPEEVSEAAGGAAVLGAILRQSASRALGPALSADPRSATAEGLRVIRTNLLFANIDQPPRVILLSSARQAEGKTTISSNLAASLAELGGRVLLIDADLRRPSLAKAFGVDGRTGLTNALVAAGNEPLENFIRRLDAFHGLSLMPSGPIPPNPAELLSSGRMRDLLRRLTSVFDTIIIDSPPLLAVADPAILATMSEAVILVIDVGQATLQTANRTRDALEQVGARVTGVVLNKLTDDQRGGYYYNYYYRQEYGYGYGPNKDATAGKGTPPPPAPAS